MPEKTNEGRKGGQPALIFVDGASSGNPGPAGIGVLIRWAQNGHQEEVALEEPLRKATNNEAEYRALIRALEECQRLGLPSAKVHMDSELVAKQMRGEYRVKDDKLLPLYIRARELVKSIPKVEIFFIPREENKLANNLAQNAARIARFQNGGVAGEGR